eukprot:g14782.t1
MDVDGLSGSVERLNLGDAPEAGALAAAVASAAVGATSSPASASGFSKAVDDSSSNNQGGSQTPGASPAAHDKDNDVEGKLFIGGISWQTTEEGLRHHFGKYGALADIALMKDKYTGHPRGFGFIKFEDLTVLDEILSQEHKIDGKVVDVKRAVPKSEAPGPSSRSSRPAETNKIFVGGLAPTVMMAEFRKYFETFGSVVDAVVMFDRQTQRSRGFGFVTFQEDSVVHEIMMGTHEINGKMVEVKRAEPKENRSGRAPRGDFAGGSSPALGGGGPAQFAGARGRNQPFGAGGRGAGAGYGGGGSFPYNNGGAPFSGSAAGSYGQQPAYGYPAAGYGYNGQLYSAPTAYGYAGRGAGAAYSAEGGAAAGSFPVTLPPQAAYGLQAQDGQAPYTQAEYAAALRNQQQAQAQAQVQQQPQAQVPQQARPAGEGSYGSQPY